MQKIEFKKPASFSDFMSFFWPSWAKEERRLQIVATFYSFCHLLVLTIMYAGWKTNNIVLLTLSGTSGILILLIIHQIAGRIIILVTNLPYSSNEDISIERQIRCIIGLFMVFVAVVMIFVLTLILYLYLK